VIARAILGCEQESADVALPSDVLDRILEDFDNISDEEVAKACMA
jgi:hypothetical protein